MLRPRWGRGGRFVIYLGSTVELYYSYSTCGGNQASWVEANMLARLKGKTIRAAIPKLYYPSHYHVNATGHIVDGAGATVRQLCLPLSPMLSSLFRLREVFSRHMCVLAYMYRKILERLPKLMKLCAITGAWQDVQLTTNLKGKSKLLPPAPHTTPFPEEWSILGLMYTGGLLWANV